MNRLPPEDPIGEPIARASTAEPAVDALEVLNPGVEITLAGERLRVREYEFFESMDLIYAQRGFLDDVVHLLAGKEAGDPWEYVRALFGKHAAYLKRIAGVSVGRDVAWVESLGAREKDALMSAWWAVNGHFFLHEATVVIGGRRSRERRSVGTNSSTPLAATSSASAGTPNAS